MAGMDWFRWHHGSVTDPKFQLVARRAGASLPDVLSVWAYVLETASQADPRGFVGQIDAEALDCLFGFPTTESRTANILRAFEQRGLIENGMVCSWEKRQPKREREDEGAAGRKRAQRARLRDLAGDDVSAGVTPSHAMSHQKKPREDESREEKKTPPQPPVGGSVGGGFVGQPTKAGTIAKAIRAKGVSDVNPSNPELLALIDKGVPVETFEAAADTAAKGKKGFAYLLGIVKRQLGEAAAIASGVGMPAKPWDESRSTIEAKGVELGIGMWDETDMSASRESFPAYTERVRRRIAEVEGAPA